MPKASKPKRAPASKAPYTSSPNCTATADADIDESSWRESVIPKVFRITKSNAMRLYRLNNKDLNGVDSIEVDTKTRVPIDGVEEQMTAYLYNERDVERVAWRKHGGPDGWEAHLAKLKERWEKRQESKSPKERKRFPEPHKPHPLYNPDAAPKVTLTPTKHPRNKKAGQEAE